MHFYKSPQTLFITRSHNFRFLLVWCDGSWTGGNVEGRSHAAKRAELENILSIAGARCLVEFLGWTVQTPLIECQHLHFLTCFFSVFWAGHSGDRVCALHNAAWCWWWWSCHTMNAFVFISTARYAIERRPIILLAFWLWFIIRGWDGTCCSHVVGPCYAICTRKGDRIIVRMWPGLAWPGLVWNIEPTKYLYSNIFVIRILWCSFEELNERNVSRIRPVLLSQHPVLSVSSRAHVRGYTVNKNSVQK